jgi:hypothetical protein
MSVKETFMYLFYFFTTKNVMCQHGQNKNIFSPPNHMALGRWGALLDQLFQVWVYKYKNNLYCGQTNKHKLFLYSNLYGKQGVCHTMALPFTLKSILGQKKNYGNSNFSP